MESYDVCKDYQWSLPSSIFFTSLTLSNGSFALKSPATSDNGVLTLFLGF